MAFLEHDATGSVGQRSKAEHKYKKRAQKREQDGKYKKYTIQLVGSGQQDQQTWQIDSAVGIGWQ